MHPIVWSPVTSNDATARQTLAQLHYFALKHLELPLNAMHDAEMKKLLKAEIL